jgi:hypothetical protein
VLNVQFTMADNLLAGGSQHYLFMSFLRVAKAYLDNVVVTE